MTFALPDSAYTLSTAPPQPRVYLEYYRLSEAPFAITPDPDFLFASRGHQQALEKISYAVDSRMGFILLTGEVGTGKTTICRTLLDRLNGRATTVYLINPSLSGHELLTGILEDAGLQLEPCTTKKALLDQLHRYLLSSDAGQPFVVIIDDAQTMSPEALEDLRLLSNLETDKRKLIQVILSGQPELLDRLGVDRLRQLRQRIAIHCRLDGLAAGETAAYIARRLFVAGNQGQVRFSSAAIRLIHKTSAGIPRLINKICDYALTAGYVDDTAHIARSHVKRALGELDGLGGPGVRWFGRRLAAAIGLLILLTAAGITLHDATLASHPSAPNVSEADDRRNPAASPSTAHRSTDEAPLALSTGQAPPPSAAGQPVGGTPAEKGTAVDRSSPGSTAPMAIEAAQHPTPPMPYALQLGSFRSRERAERDATLHRQKGVPAHWQAVGDGEWYRVVAGRFVDVTQARDYRAAQGIKGAMIINAPLTVKVLPGQPDVPDADMHRFLSRLGHDSLMEKGPNGDKACYTGLYRSLEDASAVADRINASGRYLAQVVYR